MPKNEANLKGKNSLLSPATQRKMLPKILGKPIEIATTNERYHASGILANLHRGYSNSPFPKNPRP